MVYSALGGYIGKGVCFQKEIHREKTQICFKNTYKMDTINAYVFDHYTGIPLEQTA